MINTKTYHSRENTIMDTTNASSTDDRIGAQREIIAQSLSDIVAEVGAAMREVGLSYPVYLCIPGSGNAIIAVVTALDPSNDDWSIATGIVKQIVSKKLDGIVLQSNDLQCAIASAPMGAAEIICD
jgi:hypothetical protein